MSVLSQFFGGTGLSSRNIPINFLIVSGGGGSGGVTTSLPSPAAPSAISGGGGGGAVCYGNKYYIAPGTVCPITVGAGGAAGTGIGTVTATKGGTGGSSSFQDPTGENFTVLGGGGGGGGYTLPSYPVYQNNPNIGVGAPGGTGGGGSLSASSAQYSGNGAYFTALANESYLSPGGASPVTAIESGIKHAYGEYLGFPGILSQSVGRVAGGSRLIPTNPLYQIYYGDPNVPYYSTKHANNGFFSSISGITTSYGQSGSPAEAVIAPTLPANYRYPAVAGYGPTYENDHFGMVPNFGYGALGVKNVGFEFGGPNLYMAAASPGRAGGSGVVFIQYPTAYPASPSFPGATDISPATPGFRTYRFTSPGSITLP